MIDMSFANPWMLLFLAPLAVAAWRLLRCHPFGSYGYDPVPPKGRWKNLINESKT